VAILILTILIEYDSNKLERQLKESKTAGRCRSWGGAKNAKEAIKCVKINALVASMVDFQPFFEGFGAFWDAFPPLTRHFSCFMAMALRPKMLVLSNTTNGLTP
jgi:hypothetical protein